MVDSRGTDEPGKVAAEELPNVPNGEIRGPVPVDWPRSWDDDLAKELVKLRYSHVLQQISSVNENVFRFLAIYQTLISALVAGQVLLFVNHRNWMLGASIIRIGLISILVIETIVGLFAELMIIAGILNWFDYRSEECEIANIVLGNDFRKRPTMSNWYRWYETYVILFIFLSVAAIWLLVTVWMIPAI